MNNPEMLKKNRDDNDLHHDSFLLEFLKRDYRREENMEESSSRLWFYQILLGEDDTGRICILR